MTKQDIIDTLNQLCNDKDHLEVAIQEFDSELVYTIVPVERLLELHKDMELWVNTMETSLEDLETEIKKIPNEQILNQLEELEDD